LIRLLKSDATSILAQGNDEVFLARAPGRLDVMGGITDISGGLACTLPLDAAAAVAVQRRDDRKLLIKTYNTAGADKSGPVDSEAQSLVELSLDDFYGTAALLPNQTLQNLFTGGRHWAAYIAGAFPMLARHKKITRRTHGANIACFSNVPFGAGLASSAAVASAALTAITAAFHLILDPLEIAVLAHKLEQQIVGASRGIMDQATAILGRQNELLLLRCQPHQIKGYLPVPPGFLFAGINSGTQSAGPAAYTVARSSALMAQAIIGRMYQDFGNKKDPTAGYLANVSAEMYDRYFRPLLPEKIDGKSFLEKQGHAITRIAPIAPQVVYEPRAAADHHIHEGLRTAAFVEHMRRMNDAADPAVRNSLALAAGELMRESHHSYSANLHLGSAATDELVELVRARGPDRGFFGARVMGAGGGGSVVVLVHDNPATRAELRALAEEFAQCRPGPGAGQLFAASSSGSSEIGPVELPVSELRSSP
jgi:L-arabinokinase